MQVLFSFKHMEVSEALKQYAEEKILSKIDKFVTKPIEAHVYFSVIKGLHTAHCSVKGGDGFNFEVEASCGDMYGSVDLLIDKLAVQMKKRKEILKDHKKVINLRSLPIAEPKTWEDVPIDAEDVIRFEESRRKISNG